MKCLYANPYRSGRLRRSPVAIRKTANGPRSPQRLVTLQCAGWPALATEQGVAEPVVVVRANRVTAVSPKAAEAGLSVGLRRREAQARCPDVVVAAYDPDRDARVFEPVVRAIAELVPLIEIADPGTLTFPSRGPSRYCGGDEALLTTVQRMAFDAMVAIFGDEAEVPLPSVGLADGRFTSAVAAHRSAVKGQPVLVPAGQVHSAAFLERFPVAVLGEVAGVSPDVVGLLSRLGLRTLGEVADLPAPEMLARFGRDGSFIHRLVRGADERDAEVGEPPADLTLRQDFDDPVNQIEALVFGARRMAEALYERVAASGSVCTRLLVEAETECGERTSRLWYHAVGMRPAAMIERLRWQLDGWVHQPGGLTGGVVMMALTPVEVRADYGRQLGFWGGATQADEWASRAMTRLAGLFGPEAVTVAVWRGGRQLSAVYEQVPAGLYDFDAGDPEERERAVRPSADQPWPGSLPRPLPTALLVEPRPCSLHDADGCEVAVDGRGLLSAAPAVLVTGDRRAEVTAWAGPWPIEERWWDPPAAHRSARLQIVGHDGTAYLIARQRGAWRIEAMYA